MKRPAVCSPKRHRGLTSKFPPVGGGASDWITTLEGETMGDTDGGGDLGALLSKLEGRDTSRKLLKEASIGS